MNIILRSVGICGVLIFGLLISVTFLSPKTIEQSAKGFVKYQIEKEVRAKQQSLIESDITRKVLSIADNLGLESKRIQDELNDKLPEKIASVIASMCGYDCERKKVLTQSITLAYLERINNIQVAQKTLGDIIKGRYLEIIGNLKFDLRIFLGSNFTMFLILLLVSFAKPKAMVHLLLPSVLLIFSTLISSIIYLYGQDWFYTILYNDYMGFAYLAYLSMIFGVLMDIVLNKARVATQLINGIGSVLGSAFSVVPC